MIGPQIGGMWFLDFSFCNIKSTGYPNKMLILQTGKFEIGDSSECFMTCSVLPSPNFLSPMEAQLFYLFYTFCVSWNALVPECFRHHCVGRWRRLSRRGHYAPTPHSVLYVVVAYMSVCVCVYRYIYYLYM